MDESERLREHERVARRVAESCLGVRVVRVERLAGGIGARTFLRLALDPPRPATAVARIDAAPELPSVEAEPPLEPIRAWLERAGLPVPRRLGGDSAAGVDLLEDLGDLSLERALPGVGAAERRALYREACELVARLQRVEPPRNASVAAFRRRLDAERVRAKGELFVRWSLPRWLGREPRPAEAAVVREAFAWIGARIAAAPRRLSHRDFQSSNLLLHPRAATGRRLVMIDLQGAWTAPPEYDLVCLLCDSYVDLDAEFRRALRLEAREQLPDPPDPESFELRFHLLAVARKAKDHARFLEAAALRGDRSRVRHLSRTARLLLCSLLAAARTHPALGRTAEVLASPAPEATCVR